MGTIWYNFWIQGILKTFIKFLKPIDKKLIRKYQNNTFINYTNMDYLPILAMQIQEKHAQLQPQDKFCTCSRKAIWLLSLILWKFSILNPGEKIPHYPIKCIVNSMSTWVATFSSGSAGLNSQQSSTTRRDYNKLNRPKKFTLK